MPAKAKPSAYALDLLVQTTLDNLARDAKRKLGKASAVVSFKLLRYDVALWPDSCELVLADAQAPVVIDLDRGKVSAIPGTVDDANPLGTAHRRRAPEIADDVAHRPEIELYELETAQKVARLKQSRVSALFGADTHLWAVCFEEQESDHYGYQLLDINLEPEPVIVRRLALPGLREGSPSDAQSMVRGLFVREAQALVIWENEISVFDLPA
jgi:hypothetical protein